MPLFPIGIGQRDSMAPVGVFTHKETQALDGRINYSTYREDELLWVNLTCLDASKRGPPLLGRLGVVAKSSAKTISV